MTSSAFPNFLRGHEPRSMDGVAATLDSGERKEEGREKSFAGHAAAVHARDCRTSRDGSRAKQSAEVNLDFKDEIILIMSRYIF